MCRAALLVVAVSLAGCAAPTAALKRAGPLETRHVEPELVSVRHTVAAGETLYRIAKTYELSVEALMAANGIDDASKLAVGQELVVPGVASTRPVATFDSPEPTAPARTVAAQPKGPMAPVKVGRRDGALSWPLRGVLYARFGRKGNEAHDGIDLAAPAGTPVKTAAPGTVLFAGEQKGYGLIVIVEHAAQLVTLYAHNRDVRVKGGQAVREGQVIATVGDSGKTSGPHLHFEVRREGVPVDPLEHLGPVPSS